MSIDGFKGIAEGAQAVAGIAALGVGGWWTWIAFVRNRVRFPKATVEHMVSHRRLGTGAVLLRVSVRVANRGEVLLPVLAMVVRVQQVLPIPSTISSDILTGATPVALDCRTLPWPMLDKRELNHHEGHVEIEPGEEDRTEFDFILKDDIRTVQVYSFVQNAVKRGRDIGWTFTTFHDLGDTNA